MWTARLLVAGPGDVAGDGAALGAVEPAIGAPAQAVGDRVRILQAEAFQMHDRDRRSARRVVLRRIKEQVRRIEHPDAAAAASDRRGDVQAFEKGGVLVEDAVALRVFVDGDAVLAAEVDCGGGGGTLS